MLPAAFGASCRAHCPANDSVQAAPVPTLPTQDVLSKAVSVTLSLMKPTSTLTQATQTFSGRPKPRPRTDPVAEKIKTHGRCAQ